MRTLLLAFALAACSGSPKQPPPPTGSNTPPPEGSGSTPGATPTCEEGLTQYDATAKECRLWPGGPYGKAGCTEGTREAPAGKQCWTGSHWDGHCDCVCDKGAWHDEMKHCM